MMLLQTEPFGDGSFVRGPHPAVSNQETFLKYFLLILQHSKEMFSRYYIHSDMFTYPYFRLQNTVSLSILIRL